MSTGYYLPTNDKGERLLNGYTPKLYLSVIGTAAFSVLFIVYIFRFLRHKPRQSRFMLCIIMGTFFTTLGYAVRIAMTNKPDNLALYMITTLCILLSPCAFLAQSYILLPRLATHIHAEDCLFLSSRKIVRIFVWSDVITLFLQLSGSGMTAATGKNDSLPKIGNYVTGVATAGIVAQLVSYSIFCTLLVVFGLRVRSRYQDRWARQISLFKHWKAVYYALIWASLGIMVRCVFRAAEFIQGHNGYLKNHEAIFYLLDTLPLFLGIAIWAIIWPPKVLREGTAVLAREACGLPVLDSAGPGVMSSDESKRFFDGAVSRA